MVRSTDIVARLGGDEFVVVIEKVDSSAAVQHLVQKIVELLGTPFIVDDKPWSGVTASAGVALYPLDGMSVDELLEEADAAMYQAKQRGGATVGGNTR